MTNPYAPKVVRWMQRHVKTMTAAMLFKSDYQKTQHAQNLPKST